MYVLELVSASLALSKVSTTLANTEEVVKETKMRGETLGWVLQSIILGSVHGDVYVKYLEVLHGNILHAFYAYILRPRQNDDDDVDVVVVVEDLAKATLAVLVPAANDLTSTSTLQDHQTAFLYLLFELLEPFESMSSNDMPSDNIRNEVGTTCHPLLDVKDEHDSSPSLHQFLLQMCSFVKLVTEASHFTSNEPFERVADRVTKIVVNLLCKCGSANTRQGLRCGIHHDLMKAKKREVRATVTKAFTSIFNNNLPNDSTFFEVLNEGEFVRSILEEEMNLVTMQGASSHIMNWEVVNELLKVLVRIFELDDSPLKRDLINSLDCSQYDKFLDSLLRPCVQERNTEKIQLICSCMESCCFIFKALGGVVGGGDDVGGGDVVVGGGGGGDDV